MQKSPKYNRPKKPKKQFNIKIIPDKNLKIGIFLNFGDSWYSLWKINVVDSGYSQQNIYGHPLSAIYLRGKQLKSSLTAFIT